MTGYFLLITGSVNFLLIKRQLKLKESGIIEVVRLPGLKGPSFLAKAGKIEKMSVIKVKNLKKYYQVHKKEPGLLGSLRSLFARKYETIKAVYGASFKID